MSKIKSQTDRFYVAEVQRGSHLLPENWERVKASSLKGAKVAARNKQVFQGTELVISKRTVTIYENVNQSIPTGFFGERKILSSWLDGEWKDAQ